MINNHKAILALQPKPKLYKKSVGESLFIKVYPTGKKCWSYKYRYNRKEKSLSLGEFPLIGLKEARKKLYDYRETLLTGIDPSIEKQLKKNQRYFNTSTSFANFAEQWHTTKSPGWSKKYNNTINSMIEKDINPILGCVPIEQITAQMVLALLKGIELKGKLNKAHRLLSVISQILTYAVIVGQLERDVTKDLKGALTTPKKQHLAAIIEPSQLGHLLHAIDQYQGEPSVANALKLAPHVFTRPGELRQAEWQEINFNQSLWEIPAHKMKMRQPHVVPLSPAAMAIIKEQSAYAGHSQFIFPSLHNQHKPISQGALPLALKKCGYPSHLMTVHGFRATARTLLDEELNYRIEWIEHQLAHSVRDANGRAYNRTKHIKQRTKMMNQWSHYLTTLKQNNQKETSK